MSFLVIPSLAARPIRYLRLNNLLTKVCGDVLPYHSRQDVHILPHSVLCQLLCSWQKSSTEGHHHCPKSNWLPRPSLRDVANIRHLSRGQNVVKDCSHLRDHLFDLLRWGRCYRLLKTDLQTHKQFLPETVHTLTIQDEKSQSTRNMFLSYLLCFMLQKPLLLQNQLMPALYWLQYFMLCACGSLQCAWC